jgi:hypothetical protein
MFRPEEDQDKWFNVFVLHQNRADRGPNNYISEDVLPNFLNLVIWGHEHECRIEPEWNEQRQFYVVQPGNANHSSVIVTLPGNIILTRFSTCLMRIVIANLFQKCK